MSFGYSFEYVFEYAFSYGFGFNYSASYYLVSPEIFVRYDSEITIFRAWLLFTLMLLLHKWSLDLTNLWPKFIRCESLSI